jgi:hypothetical protein
VHDGAAERVVEPPAELIGDSAQAPSPGRPAGLAAGNTLSTALSGAATRFMRPTQLLHEAFRDRILGKELAAWPPLPTFEDGVANTAAHIAIRRSIDTGLPQDVPLHRAR